VEELFSQLLNVHNVSDFRQIEVHTAEPLVPGPRKVQENQVGLKLNGTHLLLAYADDVNLLGDNTDTIKKNTETLIDARSFENVSQFKYLGTTVTNQNLIKEEIKRRVNSGNACYHSVQNLLSSRLLSKNLKIRI
jgi:hypothetical protein